MRDSEFRFVINTVCSFFGFLSVGYVQCQYTLFAYVVSYNISTLCCKVVLRWPRPNATNDEANKWDDPNKNKKQQPYSVFKFRCIPSSNKHCKY